MAGGYVTLDQDRSYHKVLDGDAFPADDKTPFGEKGLRSDLLLVVDTSTWYVFYDGTWYAQL